MNPQIKALFNSFVQKGQKPEEAKRILMAQGWKPEDVDTQVLAYKKEMGMDVSQTPATPAPVAHALPLVSNQIPSPQTLRTPEPTVTPTAPASPSIPQAPEPTPTPIAQPEQSVPVAQPAPFASPVSSMPPPPASSDKLLNTILISVIAIAVLAGLVFAYVSFS